MKLNLEQLLNYFEQLQNIIQNFRSKTLLFMIQFLKALLFLLFKMISIIILSLIVSIQCSHLYGLAGRTLNGPIGIISGYHREFKPLKNVKGFEPQFISTINSTHFAMVNSTGIDAYCLVLVKVVDAVS